MNDQDNSTFKNMILAVGICLVILLGWQYLAKEMGWVKPPVEQTAQTGTDAATKTPETSSASKNLTAPTDPTAPTAAPSMAKVADVNAGKTVAVNTPLYKAVFTAAGTLQEFSLKKYASTIAPEALPVNLITPQAAAEGSLGFLLNGMPTWTNTTWSIQGSDLNLEGNAIANLSFVGEVDGTRITRRLTFSASSYVIEEQAILFSTEAKTVKTAFNFTTSSMTELTVGMLSSLRHLIFGGDEPELTQNQYNTTRVAWSQNKSFSEETPGDDLKAGKLILGNVAWMGVMNNYFLGAVSTSDATDSSAKGKETNDVFSVALGKTGVQLEANKEVPLTCSYFLGPKDAKELKAAPNDLDNALDYGMFSIIARPLIALLQFFYGYVHNYGVAIVLMTIVVKILFWPLSQKSYKSMQQMKKLQPMMLKIREKYANDKETLNRETMQLYKTYKVNPAGGCLPILVQLPVFFGLYQALLNAIELRHAPFIANLPFTDIPWLVDLSSSDPYMITPILMGATMLIQQKITPQSADPMQAKIMMFMPLIFLVLFINFPSGLVVYWLTNNVISIAQQWLQVRKA